jgi:hypothetical protein
MTIKSVTKRENIIPYWDNIEVIHRSLPTFFRVLDKLGAIYAGGYPTALMLAPRDGEGKLESGYFQDFDIYVRDEDDFVTCHELLETRASAQLESKLFRKPESMVTQNSISYRIKHNDITYHIQLIKKFKGTPEEILSTFDFINCAFAYEPSADTIYYHSSAPAFHKQKLLEILDPWMLKQENIDDTTRNNYVVIQLLRFKKYCIRWDYTLGPQSFKLLLDLYNRNPDIITPKDTTLVVDSDEKLCLARRDFNIWHEMACLFKQTPWWDSRMDKHGHINSGSDSYIPDDNLIQPAIMIQPPPPPVIDQLTGLPEPTKKSRITLGYKHTYSYDKSQLTKSMTASAYEKFVDQIKTMVQNVAINTFQTEGHGIFDAASNILNITEDDTHFHVTIAQGDK